MEPAWLLYLSLVSASDLRQTFPISTTAYLRPSLIRCSYHHVAAFPFSHQPSCGVYPATYEYDVLALGTLLVQLVLWIIEDVYLKILPYVGCSYVFYG